jgi:hypothetical protein
MEADDDDRGFARNGMPLDALPLVAGWRPAGAVRLVVYPGLAIAECDTDKPLLHVTIGFAPSHGRGADFGWEKRAIERIYDCQGSTGDLIFNECGKKPVRVRRPVKVQVAGENAARTYHSRGRYYCSLQFCFHRNKQISYGKNILKEAIGNPLMSLDFE